MTEEVQENLETKFKVLHACADSQMHNSKKDYTTGSSAINKKPAATVAHPDKYLIKTFNTEKENKSPLTPAVLKSPAQRRRVTPQQADTAVHLTDLVSFQQMTKRRFQKRQIMSSMTPLHCQSERYPSSTQSNKEQYGHEANKINTNKGNKDFKGKSVNKRSTNSKISDEKKAIASKTTRTSEEKNHEHEKSKASNGCRDVIIQKKPSDDLCIDRRACARDSHAKQMKEWLDSFYYVADIGLYDSSAVTYDSFENRLRQNSIMNDGVITYSINGPKSINKIYFIVVKEAPLEVFDNKEPPDEHPSITVSTASTSVVPTGDVESQLYKDITQLAPNTVKNTLRLRKRLKNWKS